VRVLFVDPFFDGSHRAFGEGMARHSRHEVVLLTLPGGEWRRRMRLGAQELARAVAAVPGSFDALVATDMLDVPLFLALTRPRFENTPALAYFHENQLTYPRIRGTKLNSWFGAINYNSALAADMVAFNSAFHRDDFLDALRTLASGPNNWLDTAGIDAMEAKANVLPVGVELQAILEAAVTPKPGEGPPLILWNHRWEFDKAPDVFARALLSLAESGADFRVAIAGEEGLNPHPAMFEIREALGERIVHFGHAATRAQYLTLLAASDIVVSTTRHEFFGVGMVEAMAAGCLPVVPARYNYPALVPRELHPASLWDTEDDLRERLATMLRFTREQPTEGAHARKALRESALRFAWPRVAAQWDAAIEDLALSRR
jgi:glycosyltransferase involved in cell wall biosynthesis